MLQSPSYFKDGNMSAALKVFPISYNIMIIIITKHLSDNFLKGFYDNNGLYSTEAGEEERQSENRKPC